MTERIEGFVILGPGHPLHMVSHKFGHTAGEAWRRHIGFMRNYEIGEFETLVGRWSAKGYRPVAVTLAITPQAGGSTHG